MKIDEGLIVDFNILYKFSTKSRVPFFCRVTPYYNIFNFVLSMKIVDDGLNVNFYINIPQKLNDFLTTLYFKIFNLFYSMKMVDEGLVAYSIPAWPCQTIIMIHEVKSRPVIKDENQIFSDETQQSINHNTDPSHSYIVCIVGSVNWYFRDKLTVIQISSWNFLFFLKNKLCYLLFISKYKVLISIFVFVCPIITQKPLDRFALDWFLDCKLNLSTLIVKIQ